MSRGTFETQLHAGQTPDKETNHVPFQFTSTSYVFDDAQEGEDLFAP